MASSLCHAATVLQIGKQNGVARTTMEAFTALRPTSIAILHYEVVARIQPEYAEDAVIEALAASATSAVVDHRIPACFGRLFDPLQAGVELIGEVGHCSSAHFENGINFVQIALQTTRMAEIKAPDRPLERALR